MQFGRRKCSLEFRVAILFCGVSKSRQEFLHRSGVQLSKRQASLGIMRVLLRTPLKHGGKMIPRSLRGALYLDRIKLRVMNFSRTADDKSCSPLLDSECGKKSTVKASDVSLTFLTNKMCCVYSGVYIYFVGKNI